MDKTGRVDRERTAIKPIRGIRGTRCPLGPSAKRSPELAWPAQTTVLGVAAGGHITVNSSSSTIHSLTSRVSRNCTFARIPQRTDLTSSCSSDRVLGRRGAMRALPQNMRVRPPLPPLQSASPSSPRGRAPCLHSSKLLLEVGIINASSWLALMSRKNKHRLPTHPHCRMISRNGSRKTNIICRRCAGIPAQEEL